MGYAAIQINNPVPQDPLAKAGSLTLSALLERPNALTSWNICEAALQRGARQRTQWRWQLRAPSSAGATRPSSLRRPSRGPFSCSTAQMAYRPPLLVHYVNLFDISSLQSTETSTFEC